MAEFLFIQPSDLTNTTILGGNVDFDKYLYNIANTQLTTIEPLLGTELYDKILLEASTDTLTGLYETLYNEFVKPITKHQALAEYIIVSGFTIANGGAFKHAPENAEIMSKEEKVEVSGIYSGIADTYILRFEKWICKNILPEYKTSQDDVNASKSITNTAGWWFGSGAEPTIYE
ncbi:MAG: hypothetical protein KUG64_11160 [Cycloclasticus sp.]|nr:hypothetical protein [Cycloclasticus sp.]